MKIGFDAKRAFYNYSGLGNYSRNVIKSLHQNSPDNEYFLYTPSTRNAISFLQADNIRIITPHNKPAKILKSYWRSFLISNELEKENIDVYHGLSNELPTNINNINTKSIVTIHDLIFIRFPELYKPIDREIYTKKFKYSCKVADKVIAVSTQTKMDLINYFKVDEKKINVIFQGCDEVYKKTISEETKNIIKEKYDLPSEYILYVGTIEERKNLLNIVKALHLGKIALPLVIIGKTTKYLKKVVAYICQNCIENIYFLQDVSINDLPAIYQNAKLFIYPSIFEGFGIPILEALQSKVPVITSKGGCFEEVGGKYSVYINPMDIDEIIAAIKKVTSDIKLQENMKIKGFEHAQQFSNNKIANQIMDLYNEVLL